MAKEVFVRDKPHVNIGTLGDVEYGKLLAESLGNLDYDTIGLGSRYWPELTLSVDDDHRDPYGGLFHDGRRELGLLEFQKPDKIIMKTSQAELDTKKHHLTLISPSSAEDWGAFVHAGQPRPDNMIGLVNLDDYNGEALRQIETSQALGVKRLLLLFVSTGFATASMGSDCFQQLQKIPYPYPHVRTLLRPRPFGDIYNSNPAVKALTVDGKIEPACIGPKILQSPDFSGYLTQQLLDEWIVQPPHPDDEPLLVRSGDGNGWGDITITNALSTGGDDHGWGDITVTNARVVRGVINTGDPVDILGMGDEKSVPRQGKIKARLRKMIINQRMDTDTGSFQSQMAGSSLSMEIELLEDPTLVLGRGIEKTDIRRGMVIAAPTTDDDDDPLEYVAAFEATLYSKKKPKEIVVVGSRRNLRGLQLLEEEGGNANVRFPLTGAKASIRSIDEVPVLSGPDKLERIQELLKDLESDVEQFNKDNGNQAAGTRVRKGMQELKNLAQDIRKEVQDKKNSGRRLQEATISLDLFWKELETLGDDFDLFYEKNDNKAGTRIRKGMHELKTLAQDVQDAIGPPVGDVLLDGGGVWMVRVAMKVRAPIKKGLRFAIREGGRTVGAGQVTEIIE